MFCNTTGAPGFSEIRVAQSLIFVLCFVDHCLSFCPYSFGIALSCPSIDGFDYLFGLFKHVLHCLYPFKYLSIYLQPTCQFPNFQAMQ